MSCDSHNHPPLVERTPRGAGLCKIPPISSHATFRHHFMHFPTEISVLYFRLNITYRWIWINWPLVASQHIWHHCSSSRRPVIAAHPCYQAALQLHSNLQAFSKYWWNGFAQRICESDTCAVSCDRTKRKSGQAWLKTAGHHDMDFLQEHQHKPQVDTCTGHETFSCPSWTNSDRAYRGLKANKMILSMVKIHLCDFNCMMSARKVNNYTTQDAGDLRGMRNMSCWLWTGDKDKCSSVMLFKYCNGKIMSLLLFFKLHRVCMLLLSVVCFFNLITHSFHILQ